MMLQTRRLQAQQSATYSSDSATAERGESSEEDVLPFGLGRETRFPGKENPLRHFALEHLTPEGLTNHSQGSVHDRFENWWRSLVTVR